MARAPLRVLLATALALTLALPAAAGEGAGDEGEEKKPAEAGDAEAHDGEGAEKTPAEAGETDATPRLLAPEILRSLRETFPEQLEDFEVRAEAGQAPGEAVSDDARDQRFEPYLREEFEHYRNVGYGIVLVALPAIFATSLGVALGYCADGMDGEDCRAASMGTGVPLLVGVAILGGTFITTYGMKLDKLDKLLGRGGEPDKAARIPQLAPLLDERGRPGGIAAGFRF